MRVCNVFLPGKTSHRILSVLYTFKERIAHLWGEQSFFRGYFSGLGKFKVDKICNKWLLTSKVGNLFMGGNFSYAYLLEGVHFGTGTQRIVYSTDM